MDQTRQRYEQGGPRSGYGQSYGGKGFPRGHGNCRAGYDTYAYQRKSNKDNRFILKFWD